MVRIPKGLGAVLPPEPDDELDPMEDPPLALDESESVLEPEESELPPDILEPEELPYDGILPDPDDELPEPELIEWELSDSETEE